LLLIAQGAGVGPFIGALGQRTLRSADKDGHVILILSAKRLEDVPYLAELTNFTKQLPLTVHLALSGEPGHTIRNGEHEQWHHVMKVQIKHTAAGGHIYVSGSVGFGCSVRSCLYEIRVIEKGRYHEDCFGGRAIPACQREVTLKELSVHNKPDNLWLAIDGMVYDLTTFRDNHPGGLKTLMESAGTMADRRFYLIHSGDGSQGILAQIAQYAIGPLTDGGLSPRRSAVLAQIVVAQNILSNNTSCAAGRHMPFFIYADSLSVTRKDVEKILRHLQGQAALVELLTEVDRHFMHLKAAGWQYLANALDVPLCDREHRVFSTYSTHWTEFHALFEAMKSACCDSNTDVDDNDPFMTNFDTTLRTSLTAMIESARIAIQDLEYTKTREAEDRD
jgi:hypothetical protein